MSQQVDYIIAGQGICGSFLSWYLLKAGKTVRVIDTFKANSASRVASGVINPVTGRVVATTWMADQLLPFARQAYTELGEDLGTELISASSIAVFPPSEQMAAGFRKKAEAGTYVQPLPAHAGLSEHLRSPFGAFRIQPAYLINLHVLLNLWRQKLKAQQLLDESPFHEPELQLGAEGVSYRGWQARKLVYCNGMQASLSPYWQKLPFALNKGQALILEVPGLPAGTVYKSGSLTLTPWQEGLWWAGSSYENHFTDDQPSAAFRQKTEAALQAVLKIPYRVLDHLAAIRPAVAVERRPFVGLHPLHPQLAILNGMGTKGCSLAPWFARELTAHLLQGEAINPAASVNRFSRILSA